jgi:GH15 family glucan-1,4-alpha-glucosidase
MTRTRIEDYAMIGDCETAALVSKSGAIDWLCLPSFDSRACFSAILGEDEHGTFRVAPQGTGHRTTRRYVGASLVLETLHATAGGEVAVLDFMPLRDGPPTVVRIVEGRRGAVAMHLELLARFDYGCQWPFLETSGKELVVIGGPDALHLLSDVALDQTARAVRASFTVAEGERVAFVLTYFRSHEAPPSRRIDPREALERTKAKWQEWSSKSRTEGPYADALERSLVTLKGLTYRPTGAIVAAPTMALPERIGGVRNWDYRYCWVRDATFTLYSLLEAGHDSEAIAWRDWILRATAGDVEQMQIMYGIQGERRLPESELTWLPGYEGSKPVHLGNEAHSHFQLDVYGELMDALHLCRRKGLSADAKAWPFQCALLELLEQKWTTPDRGIWEIRGEPRRFVHSQVMAWVAFDRAIKAVELSGLDGPVEHWRKMRDRIHETVCKEGYDEEKGCFVQYFGAEWCDASLLLIPLVGFLPASDPRVRGTVAAIERDLVEDGLVMRYPPKQEIDGLPPGEGKFLACSFWLVDNYCMAGRMNEARGLLDRLIGLANDVGLLAEEYDTKHLRQTGNFPQAFSHISLANSIRNLTTRRGPASHRSDAEPPDGRTAGDLD